MTKIALDVESVLANTNAAVLKCTDKIDREEMLEKWDLAPRQWQIYAGVSDSVWRHNSQLIPPEEPMIDQHTARLAEGNTVDVVTARPHVNEQIISWLDEHGVTYRNFVSYPAPKYELDYDVYIDDNPNMFNNCRLLLRDKPWNRMLDDERSKTCDRIYSLEEALGFL